MTCLDGAVDVRVRTLMVLCPAKVLFMIALPALGGYTSLILPTHVTENHRICVNFIENFQVIGHVKLA